MDDLKDILEELLLIIADCLKDKPEVLEKLKTIREKLEKTTQNGCELCGKFYEFWVVPQKWWRKIPEELWGKHLCFECFLKYLGVDSHG